MWVVRAQLKPGLDAAKHDEVCDLARVAAFQHIVPRLTVQQVQYTGFPVDNKFVSVKYVKNIL